MVYLNERTSTINTAQVLTQSGAQTWYYMSRNGTPHGMVYDQVGGFIYEINQVPGQSGNSEQGDHFFSRPSKNLKQLIMSRYKWSPSHGKSWSGTAEFPH
jgi:hypothetical protein